MAIRQSLVKKSFISVVMDIEQIRTAQKIFESIISMDDKKIGAFLSSECGDDPTLMQTVMTLLHSHQASGQNKTMTIEHNIFKLLQTHAETTSPDLQIEPLEFKSNRYKLLKKIGFGGMGEVYLCHRTHEGFNQKVAIKVLKGLKNNAASIKRFNQEKHILAQLKHPNITNFIDTDYLKDGTPFVVMEYTPGLSINEYCRTNLLSIKQKIKLFLQLCSAVGHAHQNLIIHRDIKPSNILVTASGTVKLIDFGIAKDLSIDNNLNTQTGHHVMTPAYASPEQFLKKPLNTATDIYSLGVVLYELLTNTRPHDLNKFSPGQYEKLLFEGDIELPSKRASNDEQKLKGDLDAITLKAIQADTKVRYPSVTELIADIKRYQNNLPIKARKPNLLYKTHKFIKRNRLALTTAFIFCILTAVFVFEILAEKEFSEKERIKAKTISDSFILAFKNADPTQTLGEDIKAIHIMDQVANAVNTNHSENPLLLKELSLIIAEVYYNMGAYDQAFQLVELVNNDNSILTSNQINEWAILEANIENTIEQFDEALTTLKFIQSNNPDQELNIKYTQAVALSGKGQSLDSKILFNALIEQVTPTHPMYGEICLARFTLLHTQDTIKEQELLLNQCLNTQGTLSSQQELNNNEIILRLAKAHQSQLNLEKSNEYYLSSLRITEKIFGKLHIAQAKAYKGLGWNYKEQKMFAEALQSQNMALQISEKYFGKGHPNTTNALYNLGHVYADLKEYDQSFKYYNSAIGIMIKNGLIEEKKLAFYYKSIGHLQNDLGLYDEAEKNIKNSIEIFQLKQGNYVYRLAEMQVLLSHIYYNQQKNEQAKDLLRLAIPNMYTMHKEGDYYQVLAEDLNSVLTGQLNLSETELLKSKKTEVNL